MDAMELERLVGHLANAPVECDGMARLVVTVLEKHNIPYQAMLGEIVPTGLTCSIPHFWVQVGDLIIDYRARMWLGESDQVPDGVVNLADFEHLYQGRPIHLEPLPAVMFEIMRAPFPKQLVDGTLDNSEPGL